MRLVWICLTCLLFAACATTRNPPASAPTTEWEQRVVKLQALEVWQLDGRAAVAVAAQGWQASLNWREQGASAEVHLSGPFGVGAMVIKRTPSGISLNNAPPSDAVLAQLQERLGFELPIDHLRFWLLGVPDPSAAFELERNEQGRARHLSQADWTVEYDRYMAVDQDLLPAHLVLSREGVRVRIAVDHWNLRP
jgi:outer membrane lipoprotein LolB